MALPAGQEDRYLKTALGAAFDAAGWKLTNTQVDMACGRSG